MGLGWSLSVDYDGTNQYFAETHTDMGLSERIHKVADKVVDMSYLYEHIDPAYKCWWPGCGYPNVYLVRNDQLQTAITAPEPYAKSLPEPVNLERLPADAVVTATLWDQS